MRLLAALLLLAAPAHAACTFAERARVPLGQDHGLLTLELRIDNQPARMALDTGAQRSVVTPDAVARLHLAQDDLAATTLRGVGGITRRRNALPRSLTLGGLPLARRTLARDTTLTVAPLPGTVDGVLGRDYLASYDLVLDLPARALALYDTNGCTGAFLPPPYVPLPTRIAADTGLVIEIELDGTPLRALLDTAAARTIVTAPGMARLGLTAARLAEDPAATLHGLGPNLVPGHAHRFARLRVGPAVTVSPTLLVAPIRSVPIADAILGADWLASRRLWISFTTRQVFLAHQ